MQILTITLTNLIDSINQIENVKTTLINNFSFSIFNFFLFIDRHRVTIFININTLFIKISQIINIDNSSQIINQNLFFNSLQSCQSTNNRFYFKNQANSIRSRNRTNQTTKNSTSLIKKRFTILTILTITSKNFKIKKRRRSR